MPTPQPIELLAPARNADIAIEAIRHGADAVYIGPQSHGARAAAGNNIAEIARAVEYAHQFNARVYTTVNTLVYDSELSKVESLINELYTIGVDALIVQDLGILKLNIPPIALHASTQCDITTIEKAQFYQQCGFSQLVLPRELTLMEMREIANAVSIPIEAFVHGALCVSYSGNCQAGFATMQRSANRGECPQICRHSFNLTDKAGNIIIADQHLLSLKDLNRSTHIAQMLQAGVTSFKIEGRLKDAAYVKNVVAAYRQIIDKQIESNPQLYTRSSDGISTYNFTPNLNASFNRGFTSFFTTSPSPKEKLANTLTPKWIGEPIGKIINCKGNRIKATLTATMNNGDGIGYFDKKNKFNGLRINRVEPGGILLAAQEINIPVGTTIYRNHNQLFENQLQSQSATRTIPINMELTTTPWGIKLSVVDPSGTHISVATEMEIQPAKTPQTQSQTQVLAKTGDSIFRANKIDISATENIFIPRSLLASLRRDSIEALINARKCTRPTDGRKPLPTTLRLPESMHQLKYNDNVANHLAHELYSQAGAQSIEPALEIQDNPVAQGTTVMTTRYCLRRQFNQCLKCSDTTERKWPTDLYLQSGPIKLKIEFDCKNCRMKLKI